MALIVVTPGPKWRPLAWTPCRARLPMMVQYENGSHSEEWFRDGFDPESPYREGDVTRIGIPLWFDQAVERTAWGVVLEFVQLDRFDAARLVQAVQRPTFEDVLVFVDQLIESDHVEQMWVER